MANREFYTSKNIQGLFYFLLILTCTFLYACVSTPKQPRFSIIKSKSSILQTGKIVIAPVKVIQEYVPSGDEEMDNYLVNHTEIWQHAIRAYLIKNLSSKDINVEIADVDTFKNTLESTLEKYGHKGFINPDTGELDENLFKSVMKDIAAQYNSSLVVPSIILKTAHFTNKRLFNIFASAKAQWDGISRTVDTSGFKRFLASNNPAFQKFVEGDIPVYSLHVEVYDPQGLVYWGNGGFELRYKLDPGIISGEKFKKVNVESLFQNNEKHINEAVEKALEMLVKNTS
jgi:predicted alpha/beta hydrolase family esterase